MLTSPGARSKRLWSVGLLGCASLLMFSERGGGFCRGKEGGGLLSELGKVDVGCFTAVEGVRLASDIA